MRTVWDDIADNADQAEDLAARSRLMMALKEHVDQNGVRATYERAWSDMPLSRLVQFRDGILSQFTLDDLSSMAAKVGI